VNLIMLSRGVAYALMFIFKMVYINVLI